MSRYSSEIQTANQRMEEVRAEISDGQKTAKEAQVQLANQQSALEKRLLNSYKSDDVGYLEVMLGADDFSEFLSRMDMINMIAEDDRQLIETINETKQGAEQKVASLSGSQQELTALMGDLEGAQSNLISAREQQRGMIASLQTRMQSNQAQIAQLQAEAADIEAKMNQIQSAVLAPVETPSSSGGGASLGGNSFTVSATAYCLGGTTASGMPVGRGIIAVDPGVIPLGSRVHVSGYGDAIAADTGGAIIGTRIDVWLPCDEAYEWGIRDVTITVY